MDFSRFIQLAEKLKGENIKIEIEKETEDEINKLHRRVNIAIPASLIVALAAIAAGIAVFIMAPGTGGTSLAVVPVVAPVVAVVFGSSSITAISISIAARNAFVLLKLKKYKFVHENGKCYLIRK